MKRENGQKLIALLVIVLAALLVLSGAALAGAIIRSRAAQPPVSPAAAVDNVITPKKLASASGQPVQAAALSGRTVHAAQTADAKALTQPVLTGAVASAEGGNVTLGLYRGHAEDTTPLQVVNMFPGDTESKQYRLEVSYKGGVTVHFRADVRPGYEKLAEVLMCRVSLNGAQLYDGLMRDMPESLSRALPRSRGTTASLDYDITVYLDTSVGNEYMGKELYADFRWWVDENSSGPNDPSKPGGLIPPKTGDEGGIFLWASLAGLSLFLLLLLLFLSKRQKEGRL